MRVHEYDLGLSLDALLRDAHTATRGWDWTRGAYGHALSLPSAAELHPSARDRYANTPCTGRLADCPAFRAVFDAFPCAKVSFRLLRRPPRSAYGWHTDEWKGRGVVRFQIPIVSDASSFLITTPFRRVADLGGAAPPATAHAFAELARAHGGALERHELTPGRLHYFDSTFVHTLVNAGPAERLTLTFDLVADDWLRARFPEIEAEAEAGPGPSREPERPGRLARTADWARRRLHPIRRHLAGGARRVAGEIA